MTARSRPGRGAAGGLIAMGLVAAGCGGPPPEAAVAQVQQVVAERTEGRVVYHSRRDRAREALREETVFSLVRRPLTESSAVRVALLQSPRLQAELARLGIATADLHQAGLAENPKLWGAVRLPAAGSVVPDVTGGLTTSFLSLFTLAARQRIAEARLEAETLAVSHLVLDTVAAVRTTYVEVQRQQQRLAAVRALRVTLADPTEQTPALVPVREALAERVLTREGDLVAARERMNRLLGLWLPAHLGWSVVAPLPPLPPQPLRTRLLERTAIAQRLDLQARRARTRRFGRTLEMARDWGWLSGLSLGASVYAPPTGDGVTVGPAGAVSLPIFDQGQAAVARLEAEHARAQHRTTELAVTIRSQVRERRGALARARRRLTLVRSGPLRRARATAAAASRDPSEHARRQLALLDAYEAELDALAAYWSARHELTRVCGGALPTTPL
ncbi:MAG: TolC family protein [Myxococcota bacterium]